MNSKVDLFLLYIVEICPSRCASMGICTRQNPSNRSSPHGYWCSLYPPRRDPPHRSLSSSPPLSDPAFNSASSFHCLSERSGYSSIVLSFFLWAVVWGWFDRVHKHRIGEGDNGWFARWTPQAYDRVGKSFFLFIKGNKNEILYYQRPFQLNIAVDPILPVLHAQQPYYHIRPTADSFALYDEENGTGTTLISAIAQCPVRSILDHLTIAMIVRMRIETGPP